MTVVDEAAEDANHILDVMSDPFMINQTEVFITISIGIALYPFDNDQVDSLMQKSDTAMYQAKEVGRNTYRFYNHKKRDKSISKFSLESTLHHALEREEFKLFYQPVVQLKTGEIIGVEALIRWDMPSIGLVPPQEFITALEDSGLIIKVGRWVLESACKQGMAWLEQGFDNLKMNVNLSARQFKDDNLLQHIDAALSTSRLPAHALNLEITESMLIDDRDKAIQMLDHVNERGVSMSVDDFGTGYSSMAYLKNMPIDTIKIDRSFVCGIPHDLDDVAIIQAIDYISRNLRLNVIAEGVETQNQLQFLGNMNVYAIQGYLVSRPVPAADMENILRQHDPQKFKF
jgi:EAL domain-containing protein (putative c-di-GMP-specific phosphodiesterase class I)